MSASSDDDMCIGHMHEQAEYESTLHLPDLPSLHLSHAALQSMRIASLPPVAVAATIVQPPRRKHRASALTPTPALVIPSRAVAVAALNVLPPHQMVAAAAAIHPVSSIDELQTRVKQEVQYHSQALQEPTTPTEEELEQMVSICTTGVHALCFSLSLSCSLYS